MELKKSYRGFIVWMIAFFVFACAFMQAEDEAVAIRIIMNGSMIAIVILAFMIYRTEYVYWYTGISYEEALKAGSERRKAYAWKHLKCFGGFAAAYLVFSAAAQMLGISLGVDILVVVVGLLAVAVSTIRFKL